MDAFRRRNFGGYRTHPVYMERISNFMLTIQKPEDEQQQLEEELAEDPYAYSSNSLNTPQPVKRPGSRYVPEDDSEQRTVSRTASRTVASKPASRVASRTVSRTRQVEEEQYEAPPTNIRSSDLRNKRTALNNRNYQHPSGGNAKQQPVQRQNQNNNIKRGGPNYSVKMALSSSSFMTDSL
jgi:hypothetical protein